MARQFTARFKLGEDIAEVSFVGDTLNEAVMEARERLDASLNGDWVLLELDVIDIAPTANIKLLNSYEFTFDNGDGIKVNSKIDAASLIIAKVKLQSLADKILKNKSAWQEKALAKSLKV